MNTYLEKFSLLYPNPDVYEKDKINVRFNKNPEMLAMLGLSNIFNADKLNHFQYATCDLETLNYRFDIFADILKNKELYEIMKITHEYLIDIYDVRMAAKNFQSTELESYVYVISEIELYIKCVNYLAKSYKKLEILPESKGFLDLFNYITEVYVGDEYRNLVKNIEFLDFRVHNLRSITIGANLDSQLKIVEAGIVSVNDQVFSSGGLIDMLLKMDMKKNEYTTIAPLVSSRKGVTLKEKQIVDDMFIQTLNKIYSSSIKQWRPIVTHFMQNNTNFLVKLAPEMKFIINCADIMFELDKIGAVLCKPELFERNEKIFDIKGLYNASLALSLNNFDEVVLNDIVFDENGMIYILTGPNRGGKSVITCAIGIAQLFCQLGMLIPAQSAKISPVDCIYTHFAGNYNTLDKGRLGEECERLSAILNEVTQYSLVLLDETLSSTGSFEGSYIAAEVVSGLSLFGCRCIYSTHMHELAALVDKINAASDNKIDTLVAGIDDGERSFKIKREKPDGKSYAKDIALKYGISFEKMHDRANSIAQAKQ